jgi:F-type H+-transporting ATPase subunit delta
VASRAAKRYAQAVFDMGKECGTLDAWQGDLALLSSIFADGRIASYLTNPSVAANKKIAALESAIASWNVQPETRKLARMLIERDRVTLLPEIRDIFDDQVRAEHGIAVAHVTTAEPLTEDEQALVKDKLESLTGKHIQMAMTIDPDIIGGIVIRIGDQVIDGSVRNKLEKMRSRLMAGRA